MPTITLTFDSISEMEAFRSQGQTVQPKTNTVFIVETNFDESAWLNGIFDTLDKARKCYIDAVATYADDDNHVVHIMQWDLDTQNGKYLYGADFDID